MYFIYHRLTRVLVAKTTNSKLLNEFSPKQYEVIIY
jgi:hypothetical protein